MDVTAQLLRVYNVEKQLRGLRSRLTGAEKFLADQDKELAGLTRQQGELDSQQRTLRAQAADFEGEVQRLDAKLATIRTQMDSAQSNKEYKAFLTELNTFKNDRDKAEASALELLTKADELKKQSEEITSKLGERSKVRTVAAGDRDARHSEIATRVKELTEESETLRKDVPQDILREFLRLLDQRGDDAMGGIEIVDVKRHEFHCGVCMMAIPIDQVVGLIKGGKVTKCASCQCYLFIGDDERKLLQPGEKPKAARAPRAPKDKANAKDIAASVAKAKAKAAAAESAPE